MRFYRMKNGDIVTGVRICMGSTALKATKVYDSTFKHYCFADAVYYDGVSNRLNKDQVAVVMNQLHTAINKGEGLVSVENEPTDPFGVPKSWLLRAKGAIHDYTA